MKTSYFLIPILFFLSCNTNKEIKYNTDSNLFQSWRHSHEEDTESYKVYRNADFHFPTSRGRHAFEIKEDGVFIHHQIGPVDVPVTVEARWEMKDENKLHVVREVAGNEGFTLEILEVGPDILKIKK